MVPGSAKASIPFIEHWPPSSREVLPGSYSRLSLSYLILSNKANKNIYSPTTSTTIIDSITNSSSEPSSIVSSTSLPPFAASRTHTERRRSPNPDYIATTTPECPTCQVTASIWTPCSIFQIPTMPSQVISHHQSLPRPHRNPASRAPSPPPSALPPCLQPHNH